MRDAGLLWRLHDHYTRSILFAQMNAKIRFESNLKILCCFRYLFLYFYITYSKSKKQEEQINPNLKYEKTNDVEKYANIYDMI